MGSLPVVVMFNLPEYVAKMLFSQQNQIVQRPRVFRTNLSAYALHVGDRGGVLMTLIPSVRSTPSSGRKAPSRS